MEGYRDLVAWQKAMELVTDVYRVTQEFPKEEIYGLTSQLRRAAVSIPSNLAEGQGRNSRREMYHFAGNARGLLFEVETQIEIASRLGFTHSCAHRAGDSAIQPGPRVRPDMAPRQTCVISGAPVSTTVASSPARWTCSGVICPRPSTCRSMVAPGER